MADTNIIKLGNNDLNFKVGSSDCKIYLGDVLLYPHTPSAAKFSATYSGGQTYSAECNSSTSLVSGETRPSGYAYTAMTSAAIGDCVTSIGDYAFRYCYNLSSVTIPSGVTSIGQYAFSQCSSLSSITITDSVTSIGNGAFQNCSGLTSVTIPSSVRSIGGYVFYSCDNLTDATILNNAISSYAFDDCFSLSSVTIGSGVTSIGNGAFRYCSGLTSVVIPSSVTSIDYSAFYGCSGLTSITVEATTPPTLGYPLPFAETNCPIYVPCESVDTYKAASDWSNYESRIQGIAPCCETPENLETYALDDDFDTTKAVWNLYPNGDADLDGDEMTDEEAFYFDNAYVILSEDGQTPDYTIVASVSEDSGWTVDICEYDADGENFAGNVLTALTEDVFIGMCDYFEKPMYVMDFSQYLVGEWSEMDDNTFDLTSQIYKVKMNAQDLYYTYSIDTFSGEWGFNDSVDGMGTAYELGYNVELVDDHLEASIDIYENYAPVTSYTFSDLSSEEVIIDLDAIFGKPLYADDCNMKCVDGDDENCSLYAPLWNAFVSDGTKFNEFEVETEMEE